MKKTKQKIFKGFLTVLITVKCLLLSSNIFSQSGVSINTTGVSADASAILDVSSVDLGVLIPRISLTSTTSSSPIINPATSLLVYNTATVGDVTPGFYYWDGTQWVRLATGSTGVTGPTGADGATGPTGNDGGFTYKIGQEKDGGIIFYLYIGDDGLEHGLIVSKTEQASTKWQNAGALVNANSKWDGAYNTSLMTDSPAKNYVQTLGPGWYLPSIDELSILWQNRYLVDKALNSAGCGGCTLLSDTSYWSSTERGATYAWRFFFDIGYVNGTPKTDACTVRGVRAF